MESIAKKVETVKAINNLQEVTAKLTELAEDLDFSLEEVSNYKDEISTMLDSVASDLSEFHYRLLECDKLLSVLKYKRAHPEYGPFAHEDFYSNAYVYENENIRE